MVFLLPDDSTTSHLVWILAGGKPLTAKELHQELTRKRLVTTLQRIYQILSGLTDRGIVIRNQKKFRLRTQWLVELLAWTHNAWEVHLNSEQSVSLPKPGESIKHRFSRLVDLVAFWTNSLTQQLARVGPQAYYEQLPHLWFHLVNAPREKEFLRLISQARTRYYIACRGATPLDRTYSKYFKNAGGVLRFGEAAIPTTKYADQYIGVLGPFVTVVKLSPVLENLVNGSYRKSRADTNIAAVELARALHSRGSITLTTTNDELIAKRLEQHFCRYFGLASRKA